MKLSRNTIRSLFGVFLVFTLPTTPQADSNQAPTTAANVVQTPVPDKAGQSLSSINEPRSVTTAPIRVEVSQATKAQTFIDLIGTLAWPILVLIGLLLLHKPLGAFLTDIGKRASEISVGVFSLKLPTIAEAPIGGDVVAFKAMEGSQVANDSAKTTLFKEFRTPGYRQFLVIKLGSGYEWLSSRLFIFALMLQRMKGIRAVVFVEYVSSAAGSSDMHYVGVSTPEQIRWGLAKAQPWLEFAYAAAYSGYIASFAVPGATLITSSSGALEANLAENVVRGFVRNLLWTAPGKPVGEDWIQLGTGFEHTTWVDSSFVRGILGDNLWTDTVSSDRADPDKVKLLLRKRWPYAAVVQPNGDFVSLVDRIKLLQEMGERLG